MKRIAIFGAGAIGGRLAASCLDAGAEVTILARGATHDALKADGLRVACQGAIKTYPVTVTKAPRDLRHADLLILGLKAHDLPGVADSLAEAIGPETVVMPAINGIPFWFFDTFGGPARGLTLEAVDPGGTLCRIIPVERLVGAVIYIASSVAAPGHIKVAEDIKVWLGDIGEGRHAAQVAATLSAGGLPAEETDRIHWEVWRKLCGNASLNPLSALSRADLSTMLADDKARALTASIMREMCDLGARIGLHGFDDPETRLKTTARLGPIKTSMLQDIEAGRPIEIDPILGSLVELARHLDHPTPFMDGIYGLARVLNASSQA